MREEGEASAPVQTGEAAEADESVEDVDSAATSTATSDTATSAQTRRDLTNYVGVVDPWVDGGIFATGDADLDQLIKKMCDEQSDPSLSASQNAHNTYLFVANTDYVERVNNQSPWGETWDIEYAKQYFDEGYSGNCYNFTAVIEYVLKYFGYTDAEAEPCVVQLSSDNWGDHGLVFVTNIVDGEASLVDAARYEEGWMLGRNAYNYDVRNVNQKPTVTGNADVVFDDDNPIAIKPAPGLEPTDSDADTDSDSVTDSDDDSSATD